MTSGLAWDARAFLLMSERGVFEVLAEVADGDEAMDTVLRLRPDVCLLDVDIPGGGIETARAAGGADYPSRCSD